MKTWEGDEDANLEECKLLSGGFAALLQVLLGLIALSVLIIKRWRETPRRPLVVWSFDAAKQLVGAGFAHVANLFIAILLYSYENHHHHDDDDDDGVDQCAFYFVNFTLDTTLGVFLNWVFLTGFSMVATHFQWTSFRISGDYGNPVQVSIWVKQVVLWISIIFATKFVIALLIVAFEKQLGKFAHWLFTPLQPHPDIELAVVMIACPCMMNALQFWIQDSFLKKDVRDESIPVSTTTKSPDVRSLKKKQLDMDSKSVLTTDTEEEDAEENGNKTVASV